MSYEIVVSKPGNNVLTTTAPDDLIYSSQYNTLKYHAQGSISVTLTAGTPSVGLGTINHNLGYFPFYGAYAQDYFYSPVRYYPLGFRLTGGGQYIYLGAYVGTTDLVFRAEESALGSTVTWICHYKIYRNNLNL